MGVKPGELRTHKKPGGLIEEKEKTTSGMLAISKVIGQRALQISPGWAPDGECDDRFEK
jgi:hypothetical protein